MNSSSSNGSAASVHFRNRQESNDSAGSGEPTHVASFSRFSYGGRMRYSGLVGVDVEESDIPRINPDSPLRRAGLLQPKSYNPPSSMEQGSRPIEAHSQDTIRLDTVQLSDMILSPPIHGSFQESFIRARDLIPAKRLEHDTVSLPSPSLSSPFQGSPHTSVPPVTPSKDAEHPSGITLLARRNEQVDNNMFLPEDTQNTTVLNDQAILTSSPVSSPTSISPKTTTIRWEPSLSTENTPLLADRTRRTSSSSVMRPSPLSTVSESVNNVVENTKHPGRLSSIVKFVKPHYIRQTAKTVVKSLPAVLLGSLLNILDGVSYGMIIFPASGVFANLDLGPMGVSMFFLSTIICQLVFTFGGSGFAGANGSMMIEVVPFFHIIALSIAAEIGDAYPHEIIATTLVAFAFSSILTGLSFFLLGSLKLGGLIGFFPRHILVGCIGGVGVFLLETGLTVSMRIDDDDFTMTWSTFKFMFLDSHNLAMWTIPLALAILLRIFTHFSQHQLLFPSYFIVIPAVFYVIVAAARLDLGVLRSEGWLFDMGSTSSGHSWYEFYSYLDFSLVRWKALWFCLPTQFALLFFNILHPPLNVPALAVSLNDDVDTDKELVAHGYSNLFAGLFGTVPNYLVYVNTLLFYRVGGTTRIAGFLLALATFALLLVGTSPIAFIPVMVVGALIFVLGIDLVKEALWDTRKRVSRSEYITIVCIMVCMTVWDFVVGVLFGIVVSCVFFVVQNSQRRSIRALHTGETVMSTVRRPGAQRAYIREVSKQTTVFRLQGFLFFGTITYVEQSIRNTLDGPAWHRNPCRFMILDFSLVAGVDMSSAEALVRTQRLLWAKAVTLVFCGFDPNSPVGLALNSVELLGVPGVEVFSTFNDALEWTENSYLRAWFRSQKTETIPIDLPGRQDAGVGFQQSVVGSPRRSHLHDVAYRTIAHEIPSPEEGPRAEPYNTLVKVFSHYANVDFEQLQLLTGYLERQCVPSGHVLWNQDDESDGLYIIEAGILRASYHFAGHTDSIIETMVPGTLAGELSALSNLPRNATATVEREAVMWKLSLENLRKLEQEKPELARTFIQLVLKAAKIDFDILLSALASRQ